MVIYNINTTDHQSTLKATAQISSHAPVQCQPIHQSFLQGHPTTGWPRTLWSLSWKPPPPWIPPPKALSSDSGSESNSARCDSLSPAVHKIRCLQCSCCVSPPFCLNLQTYITICRGEDAMPRKSYDIFLFFLGLSHAASSDCHPANKDLYLKYVDSFKCTVYQR